MWYKSKTGNYYNFNNYINIKQIDNCIIAQDITKQEQTIETFKDTIRAYKFMKSLFRFLNHDRHFNYNDVIREHFNTGE